jgi:hypothetical protein
VEKFFSLFIVRGEFVGARSSSGFQFFPFQSYLIMLGASSKSKKEKKKWKYYWLHIVADLRMPMEKIWVSRPKPYPDLYPLVSLQPVH